MQGGHQDELLLGDDGKPVLDEHGRPQRVPSAKSRVGSAHTRLAAALAAKGADGGAAADGSAPGVQRVGSSTSQAGERPSPLSRPLSRPFDLPPSPKGSTSPKALGVPQLSLGAPALSGASAVAHAAAGGHGRSQSSAQGGGGGTGSGSQSPHLADNPSSSRLGAHENLQHATGHALPMGPGQGMGRGMSASRLATQGSFKDGGTHGTHSRKGSVAGTAAAAPGTLVSLVACVIA
jgi:hypothetical protein